jgi:hypothetical protein
VLGEKGLGEVNKIGDNLVVRGRPVRRKLKAVARFLALATFGIALFLNVRVAGGVAVIFRVRTIGDKRTP